jgi:hypothetical protein
MPEEVQVDAWWWLSQVADDPAEVSRCIEEVLVREPSHPQARRAKAVMDGRLKAASVIDADHLPRAPDLPEDAPGGERFACRRCGGRLAASADGAWLACGYCGWRRSLASGEAVAEQDFVVMATARTRPERTRRFVARRGAFILALEMLSLTCLLWIGVFDTPVQSYPPDGISPFRSGSGAERGGGPERTWQALPASVVPI